MDGTIGEIMLFTGDFAPEGWAFCHGQSLQIAEYYSLFQLIDFMYGGNGQTAFNVPDLRGRVPIGMGQGPGLPNYLLAASGGSETNILTVGNLPPHSHTATDIPAILVSGEDGHKTTPANNYPAVNGNNIYSTISDSQMASAPGNLTVGNTGNATPVQHIQPYLAINYIICCWGMYPTT